MASVRKPTQPTKPGYRIELFDSEGNEIGYVPLAAFIAKSGNEWYGVPDPRTDKPANPQYGITVSSKLVGLEPGQLPDEVALFMDNELTDRVELEEGETGSGNPKRSIVATVETENGMRRLTFRISSLSPDEKGGRHNLVGSITRTGGGSGTITSWS